MLRNDEQQDVKDLKDKLFDQLKLLHYKTDTIHRYQKIFMKLEKFLWKRGVNVYTPELGKEFIVEEGRKLRQGNRRDRQLKAVIKRLDNIV